MNSRILSLIVYRLVLASLILIYQLLALVLRFPLLPFKGILVLVIAVSLLSGLYLLIMKRKLLSGDQAANFIFLQFAIDIFSISVLVILTGGIESNLRFAYLIIILLSAVYLEKMSIYVITVLSLSFFYLSLNITALLESQQEWNRLFDLIPNIRYALLGQFVLCFLTALLAGFIQTAYRSTREALRVKEQRIRDLRTVRRKIVESLPSGLITCDRNGGINFINQMGLKLLRRVSAEMMERNAWELFDLEPPDNWENGRERQLSRGERKVAVSGGKKIFGISYRPIEVAVGQEEYLIVFQDLTKIKLLEEHKMLADTMSALGKMAAGVAHEIRNPLAAISGSIQVLKELIPKDETAKELAEIVERESSRLNDIISQFLAYARPGSPPNFKPVHLAECVSDFVRLTKNDSQMKTLDIVTHYGEGDLVLLGDQFKLNQVFWNLLRNSHQACEGRGTVFLRCFLEDGDVCFKIDDKGIGMTKEQLKDLFTPFQSFNRSGSGLGMSIVYEIVQMHHGKIDVSSEVDVGTAVVLRFPRYKE